MTSAEHARMSAPVRRAPALASRELDGETVVVTLRAQNVHFLNETAGAVFDLVDGARTGFDLARELAARFEVAAEEAEADVLELLNVLERAGIVIVAGETEAP